MKSRILPLLLLGGLLASGCTHRHVVVAGGPPDGYRVASQATASRNAEVLTRDGQIFRWYNVRLTPDSIRGVVLGSGAAQGPPAVPTEQVMQVTVRSRSKGMLEGAAVGAGLGAVLGLLVGAEDGFCTDFCASSRGEQAFQLGVASALWGVVIGAIRASRTEVQVRR